MILKVNLILLYKVNIYAISRLGDFVGFYLTKEDLNLCAPNVKHGL